ncbi:NUDIX domain-containing protein [Vibrio nigripulchritudo]|uniref:NUDIX domain-containing protein n=1 Tax=Vibrio nigripulchritudo TaxID=28173 RepID=UPI0003B20E41|nr:NUDIX domain-containing protein [Vibrio nigripulchritudo]CCN70491.1 MutT/nudix family protein [Vibrio nigripulchritudo SFn118]
MSASQYIKDLRSKVGSMPLLIPGVAGVILNADNQLLLQKKADGSWSLPAGMIEPKESPTQALVREVNEETGFLVKPLRLLGVFGGDGFGFTYPNGDSVEYTVLMFECSIIGESQIGIDEETVELSWFSKELLPDLALPYPVECLFGEVDTTYFSC